MSIIETRTQPTTGSDFVELESARGHCGGRKAKLLFAPGAVVAYTGLPMKILHLDTRPHWRGGQLQILSRLCARVRSLFAVLPESSDEHE